jgi:hypothetical protein
LYVSAINGVEVELGVLAAELIYISQQYVEIFSNIRGCVSGSTLQIFSEAEIKVTWILLRTEKGLVCAVYRKISSI